MRNIIFDFGGVLLEWSSDYFYLPYFNYDKQKMENFYNDTQIKVLNKEIDRGVPFDNILKELVLNHPQHNEPILLWKKAWHKMIGNKITGSIDILHRLHKAISYMVLLIGLLKHFHMYFILMISFIYLKIL